LRLRSALIQMSCSDPILQFHFSTNPLLPFIQGSNKRFALSFRSKLYKKDFNKCQRFWGLIDLNVQQNWKRLKYYYWTSLEALRFHDMKTNLLSALHKFHCLFSLHENRIIINVMFQSKKITPPSRCVIVSKRKLSKICTKSRCNLCYKLILAWNSPKKLTEGHKWWRAYTKSKNSQKQTLMHSYIQASSNGLYLRVYVLLHSSKTYIYTGKRAP
jgi:hypothetical protein